MPAAWLHARARRPLRSLVHSDLVCSPSGCPQLAPALWPPAAAGIIPNFMVQGGDFTNGNGQCDSIIALTCGWLFGCRLVTLPASWFRAHPSQPYLRCPRTPLPPRHGRQVHLWPHLPRRELCCAARPPRPAVHGQRGAQHKRQPGTWLACWPLVLVALSLHVLANGHRRLL